jgi:UTP--glucose-1-phosphate uridylyltransferase
MNAHANHCSVKKQSGGLIMSLFNQRINPFVRQMREARVPEIVIANFSNYYRRLLNGETGLIPESDIRPVDSLPDAESLPSALSAVGERHITQTAIIKLNGGLGTSMGMKGAKSLLNVKDSYSFMDIIIRQARYFDERLPVIFMNSFSTRADTLKTLKKYPELWGDIPVDFLQHKIPKINAKDLSPADWPNNPQLEWCPPGHGDIYTALVTSGMLEKLLAAGYEYAFVSNADNLGAVIDPSILGYFVQKGLSFMMEVADRTERDKKGGHLAQLKSGRFVLREVAQCSEEDMRAFQDIERHRYFNTNNIWIHLRDLKNAMDRKKGLLGLPMIRNQKTVDPRNSGSTPVIQLETAMGAAISVFYAAGAIRVPRIRFAPVKSTNDLLAIRSDRYILNDRYHVVPNPKQKFKQLKIDLDSGFYKRIDDFESRFAYGPPSLINCRSLKIKGDFTFGSDIRLEGGVALLNRGSQPFGLKDRVRIKGEFRV